MGQWGPVAIRGGSTEAAPPRGGGRLGAYGRLGLGVPRPADSPPGSDLDQPHFSGRCCLLPS